MTFYNDNILIKANSDFEILIFSPYKTSMCCLPICIFLYTLLFKANTCVIPKHLYIKSNMCFTKEIVIKHLPI